MAEPLRCPKCGRELPPDAPSGICPNCLMHKGIQSTAGYDAAGEPVLQAGADFGPYRIIRLLGKGGMGAVYEAEQQASGRRVALKVLNHKLQSPEHRRRFLREGRLAASVNHPNNVYIYGTEEIEGTPVIAMELARGGTLQERVKRDGPLPISEAVDMVLDIVSGLEAAQAAGVLHRDVKPSNCFLDAGGVVKIGDFGLSISTALRSETNLTQSGVFLGTPAFSSPEQLRGDELDVRSDIYSVGVTLYYLLTGKPPFEGKQMVQLLATVLERPAPSPRTLRPEIPAGLAKVILRCLAKQSTQRYRDYSELRQALILYGSAAPTPGTVGFRILASAVDFGVVCILSALLPLLWVRDLATWQLHFEVILVPGPQATAQLNWLATLGSLLVLIYYTPLEGIWGASAGKAICRLRVVGANREPPGILRAFVRAVLFAGAGWAPYWIVYVADPEFGVDVFAAEKNDVDTLSVGGVCALAGLLLFVSMRRKNGYAGLHELATGTRVVRVPAMQQRPALEVADEPLPETHEPVRIGPYDVLGPLESAADHELILAYDTSLLRKVWIRRCSAGTPPISSQLRQLSRAGRLRWLGGHRGEQGGWDAFEAPSGQPLLKLISSPQPWDAVRFWLLDLACELQAGRDDATLPGALDLDRVWITADGRAKLLDFPAPGLAASSCDSRAAADTPSAHPGLFLKRAAVAALEAQSVPEAEAADRKISCRLPLAARSLLEKLGKDSGELPVAELESLTQRPASVSGQRRAGALAACWLFPVLVASAFLITYGFSERQFLRKYPEVGQLAGYVDYYQTIPDSGSESETAKLRTAIELVTASRFREAINNSEIWAEPAATGFVSTEGQELLKKFVDTHPSPSLQEVAEAERVLEPVEEEIWLMSWSTEDFLYSGSLAVIFLGSVAMLLAVFVAVPSLVSAALFGNTLLLKFLEIDIVNRQGEPASRLRVVWRNAVLWTLVGICLWLLILLTLWVRPRLGFVLVLYSLVLLFTSQRGLHDKIAGTWLVPR